MNEKKWWSQTTGKDHRNMVIQEVRNEEDNKNTHKKEFDSPKEEAQ